MLDFKTIQKELLEFLRSYLVQSKAKGFVLGLSGGLDSAVVAKLCSFIAPTHALLMPTNSSSKEHFNDAINLANFLGLNTKIINISNILSTFCMATNINNSKIRIGNLAARIRMSLLYDYSNENSLLVVGTSNKSERMLGYGTIYGDLACALNPIGELFKSEIFEFAKFLNIDEKIINKAPSADLWENQSDEKELGYSYAILDKVLIKICQNSSFDELKAEFGENLSKFVTQKVAKNSFKTTITPIAQISVKRF